jgi:hypothetical protein
LKLASNRVGSARKCYFVKLSPNQIEVNTKFFVQTAGIKIGEMKNKDKAPALKF